MLTSLNSIRTYYTPSYGLNAERFAKGAPRPDVGDLLPHGHRIITDLLSLDVFEGQGDFWFEGSLCGPGGRFRLLCCQRAHEENKFQGIRYLSDS